MYVSFSVMFSHYFVFLYYCSLYVFFFKQKTAYEMRISDWSSDVCSSDLIVGRVFYRRLDDRLLEGPGIDTFDRQPLLLADQPRADPARFRNIFLAHEHIAVLAR